MEYYYYYCYHDKIHYHDAEYASCRERESKSKRGPGKCWFGPVRRQFYNWTDFFFSRSILLCCSFTRILPFLKRKLSGNKLMCFAWNIPLPRGGWFISVLKINFRAEKRKKRISTLILFIFFIIFFQVRFRKTNKETSPPRSASKSATSCSQPHSLL